MEEDKKGTTNKKMKVDDEGKELECEEERSR
jgi:hypothetical protein